MTAAAVATAADPITDLAARILEDGYCVLPGLLPVALIDRWREAFEPLYAANLAQPTNRGPGRRYLDLPFAPPFSDPAVYEHPTLLALIEALLGHDPVLLHLGTDTPDVGSEDQGVHSDLPELFPGNAAPAPFSLAVNFPMVDVTAANGPFECAPGSHRLTQAEGYARLAAGEPLRPVLLERGDVLVRDPRMLHRGTANRSGSARPVVVVAYHRPWYRHGGFPPIAPCAEVRNVLTERGRRLLRLHLDHHAIV